MSEQERGRGAGAMGRAERRDAVSAATELTFGPVAFQAALVMRDRGILSALADGERSTEELVSATGVSTYGVETLCEAGISFGLVTEEEGERWALTPLGWAVDRDPMTRVNMDFMQDVCFLGLHRLGEAIDDGSPAGLKTLGDWETIYAGLADLPEPAHASWLRFDHFHSDSVFPRLLPRVFERAPARVLDVGGNTGRWALSCCAFDPSVEVTILDLPGQLADAADAAVEAGFEGRIHGVPIDLLDPEAAFPEGFDAVWVSQVLVCFDLDQIEHILRRAAAAVAPGGSVWILDNYWDRQRHPAARYALHGTSLYFTALANGTSRVYRADHVRRRVEAAGLQIVQEIERLGASGHTLWRCVPAGAP